MKTILPALILILFSCLTVAANSSPNSNNTSVYLVESDASMTVRAQTQYIYKDIQKNYYQTSFNLVSDSAQNNPIRRAALTRTSLNRKETLSLINEDNNKESSSLVIEFQGAKPIYEFGQRGFAFENKQGSTTEKRLFIRAIHPQVQEGQQYVRMSQCEFVVDGNKYYLEQTGKKEVLGTDKNGQKAKVRLVKNNSNCAFFTWTLSKPKDPRFTGSILKMGSGLSVQLISESNKPAFFKAIASYHDLKSPVEIRGFN